MGKCSTVGENRGVREGIEWRDRIQVPWRARLRRGRRGRSGGRVLPGPTLVEVVVGDGLGVGGIEIWGLVEVVWSGTQADLFCFGTAEIEVEAVWGGPRAG